MNVFVLAILFYLLYRFIAGFLIPFFRTTRHMRQQFHNMNGGANGEPGSQSANGPGTAQQPDAPKSASGKVGEYIDFEEVK